MANPGMGSSAESGVAAAVAAAVADIVRAVAGIAQAVAGIAQAVAGIAQAVAGIAQVVAGSSLVAAADSSGFARRTASCCDYKPAGSRRPELGGQRRQKGRGSGARAKTWARA